MDALVRGAGCHRSGRRLPEHHNLARRPTAGSAAQSWRIPPLSFLADLAGYFIVTNTMSLGILQVRDEIPHAVLWPMLPVFVAAAVVGNVVGLRIAGLLPTKVFRAAVIALVIAAGALTIASS